jgi:hypothetical protein
MQLFINGSGLILPLYEPWYYAWQDNP